MDSTSKEKCKYWDKCYQKNEEHLKKYKHPEPTPSGDQTGAQTSVCAGVKTETKEEKDSQNKKRKSSEGTDDNTQVPKKNNPQRLWQSPDNDYSELVKSNKFIHAKFMVKMPKDFYEFWDFTNFMIKEKGLKHPFRKVNLELVGPYDFLAGKFADVEQKMPGDYLRHWRFYYDPPEFQTVFVKKGTGIHYGYWRDDPKDEEKLLIARNDAEKGCHFEFVGTNMFDAIAYFLEKDFIATPFNQTDLSKVRKGINEYVSLKKIERSPLFVAKAERWKAIAAKTFHGAGIVVPVDKKSIGYRPLIESDANLKKIFAKLDDPEDPETALAVVMEKLQPIMNAAVIALDECDFGTSLELGIDLFCSGHEELQNMAQDLLRSAYTLLERPQLLAILKAHLENRRKAFDLSVL